MVLSLFIGIMHFLIGMDEAGRGPWAGPIVVGGFMCASDFDFQLFAPYLRDSKKMTQKEREHVFALIEKVMEENICRYHFAYRDACTIDMIGIREANRQCMEEVLLSLLQYREPTDRVIVSIDGCDNYIFMTEDFEYCFAKKSRKNKPIQNDILKYQPKKSYIEYIIGGDDIYPSISLASVIAKVIRDSMLCDFHEDFPEYGFHSHKGYGTSKHRQAIMSYGITPMHRKSYEPMKSLILKQSSI